MSPAECSPVQAGTAHSRFYDPKMAETRRKRAWDGAAQLRIIGASVAARREFGHRSPTSRERLAAWWSPWPATGARCSRSCVGPSHDDAWKGAPSGASHLLLPRVMVPVGPTPGCAAVAREPAHGLATTVCSASYLCSSHVRCVGLLDVDAVAAGRWVADGPRIGRGLQCHQVRPAAFPTLRKPGTIPPNDHHD